MASDVDVREMLLLQMSEIEMLQSMFPDAGEFILDYENAINEIQGFLEDQTDYETLTVRFGFTLKINVQEKVFTRFTRSMLLWPLGTNKCSKTPT